MLLMTRKESPLVSRPWILLLSAFVAFGSIGLLGQAPNGTPQSVAPAQQMPIPVLIKKAIVFVETDCLYDFSKDADGFDRESFLRMSFEKQQLALVNLNTLAVKLRFVKAGLKSRMSKDQRTSEALSAQDAARLATLPSPTDAPQHNADEVAWTLRALVHLNTFTDDEISSFRDQDFLMIPQNQSRGTGFLVGYPDARIKPQPGDTSPRLFRYLVTNRHMIQPGIEHGKPCKTIRSLILLNHNPDATHASRYADPERADQTLRFVTPADPSVDLAVAGIGFDETQYDHLAISTGVFVTDEEIKSHKVVEGDSVLFAGLFTQSFDQLHTLEPIVRSGTLALIPEGTLQTTLSNLPGHVYLAEAHVFGGNSGSPIFVDPNKFQGIISGPSFQLLGIISGEVFENSDLTLTTVSSMSANIAGNSGVSMVVPVSELAKLLDHPDLKARRDQEVAKQ